MVQCEMCGAETASPRTAKIEGAELQVCDSCVDFGTEIRQPAADASSSTKYSTSSGGASTGGSGGGSSGGSGGTSRRRRDMFDDMEEIVEDYDEVIRRAREAEGLSREELGAQLNEKASFIRKLERGESLPADDIRRKLERALGIDLVAGGDEEEAEWSGGGSSAGMTLGDVVKRKD